MTLVKCPDCSADVSTSSPKCMRCGCPVGPQPIRLSGRLLQAGVLVLCCAAAVGVVALVVSPSNHGATASRSGTTAASNVDVHGAWAYIQLFVEKRLKSPGSADFPFGGHRHVKSLGGGRYSFDSYVDSQNSFGAKLRTHFEGVIRKVPSGWELEHLQFKS